jgi:DNA-directed RNA polymerase subunit M/transcription elongation factor TFIIS
MAKLQCPKCKHTIEISQKPADNKVTCDSCQAQFSLKSPAKAVAASSSKASATSSNSSAKTSAATGKPTTKPAGKSQADPKGSTVGKSVNAEKAADPFSAIDLSAMGRGKRVDLGVAPISSAASESPQSNLAPWLAGNASAYVPLSESEVAAMKGDIKGQSDGSVAKPSSSAKPKSNLKSIIIVSTVLTLMLIGAVVAAVIAGNKAT